MNPQDFISESKLIAGRNVSSHVLAVTAAWHAGTATLNVSYFTDRQPEEDDEEWCELTCAELVAAFPDIRNAEITCTRADGTMAELAALPDLVYLRP